MILPFVAFVLTLGSCSVSQVAVPNSSTSSTTEATKSAQDTNGLLFPTVTKNASVDAFRYIIVAPTYGLMSSTGSTYGGYGSSVSKSVNPRDVIAGELMKRGFIVLPSEKPEVSAQTLIVSYGESGRRTMGLGYALEITLQFISADSYKLIWACTAEGKGSTEADDIRQAISRALSALFDK